MDPEMIPRLVQLLQSRKEPSRNRSFEEFDSNDDIQVLRYYKLVKSLERELMDPAPSQVVKVNPTGASQVEIRIEIPVLRYTRSCFLPAEVFACLAERLGSQGLLLQATLPGKSSRSVLPASL